MAEGAGRGLGAGGQGCGRVRTASLGPDPACEQVPEGAAETRPPRVLEPLKDVVLIEGSAAKLTCHISAFPDPFIRWSKDGKELRDGPNVFEDPDVVALVVCYGELADLDQYSINITNPFSQCSDSVRILVKGTCVPAASAADAAARLSPGLTESGWACGQPSPWHSLRHRVGRGAAALGLCSPFYLGIPSHPG